MVQSSVKNAQEWGKLSDRISAGQKENVRILCFNQSEIEQY